MIVLDSDKIAFLSLHNSLTGKSLPIGNQNELADIILIVSLSIPTVLAILMQLMVIRERRKIKNGSWKLTDKELVNIDVKFSTKTYNLIKKKSQRRKLSCFNYYIYILYYIIF